MGKKKIVVFIDWFYPAFKAGGPIKSVYNLVQALQEEYNFLIVSSDQDIDGTKNKEETNTILDRESYKIIFLSEENQAFSFYKKLIQEQEPSTVYFNSLFSLKFTLIPYLVCKVLGIKQTVIAPRGMLTKGALSIKPVKKKVFLFFAKTLFFNLKQIKWHASTTNEEEQIRNVFGNKANIKVAQNLPSPLNNRIRSFHGDLDAELKLIIIARISPIKNILWLLELLNDLKEVNYSLTIYGPIEDEMYWKDCKKIIDTNDNISFEGIVHPQEVGMRIHEHHFFILPTENENYGHAIVEAISSGVPVLISEGTPWRNLNEFNVGYDISIKNKEQWLEVLHNISKLSDGSYEEMMKSCYNFTEKFISKPEIIEDNIKLFSTWIKK